MEPVSLDEREELKKARDKGVAWLNVAHPDWKERIKKDYLDLGDSENCILGQLSDERDYETLLGEHDHRWAHEHGFYYVSDDWQVYKPRYEVLTELWKEIL